MALSYLYKQGPREAHPVGRTDVYQLCCSVALGGHRCCAAQLDLGLQRRGWLCYRLDCALFPEPMAEAATGSKWPPPFRQCPPDG